MCVAVTQFDQVGGLSAQDAARRWRWPPATLELVETTDGSGLCTMALLVSVVFSSLLLWPRLATDAMDSDLPTKSSYKHLELRRTHE